jgi:glutathione S-transferase
VIFFKLAAGTDITSNTMPVRRVLHQFPASHYCEKTRWNLDAKGLAFRVVNQLPGAHVPVNRKLSGVRTVPLLRDGARAIGDSTEIALYLEEAYPDRPLVPREPGARARVLELERYFSATFGPEVRRLCYGEALRYSRGVRKLFFRHYPAPIRLVGPWLMGGVLERQLYKMYELNDAGLRIGHARVDEATDRLERELAHDPARYLAGDRLSLADISAASLLAPVIGPPGSAWEELPDELHTLHALRKQARERCAGQWVLWVYARDRASS